MITDWFNRNLMILLMAQSLGMCANFVIILTGGIIGQQLSDSSALATLPPTLTIFGAALTAAPASLLMGRLGRKIGFLFGSLFGICGMLLSCYGIYTQHFWVFCLGTLLTGINIAFIQQYRYAAAEAVAPAQASHAISLILLSGLFAAIIGPELAVDFNSYAGLPNYTLAYLVLVGIGLMTFLILIFYQESPSPTDHSKNTRSLTSAAGNPGAIQSRLIIPIATGAMAFSVMSLIMTATPLNMHTADHFSMGHTKQVIQGHILAMFLPSLFSGFLIKKWGELCLISIGCFFFLVCIGINLWGNGLVHYTSALIALGVGWNFCFVSATSLLSKQATSLSRFRDQAINDFCVFTCQATATLACGTVLAKWDWHVVNLLALPAVILILVLLGKQALCKPPS